MLLIWLLACNLMSDRRREQIVDPDADGVPWPEDCDDTRGDVYPGAEEICGDGVGNNCDGDGVDLPCPPGPDDSGPDDSGGRDSGGDDTGPVPGWDARLAGEAAGDAAGTTLRVSDLNGDGRSDLLIGAPGLDDGATDAGGVYVALSPRVGDGSLADADARLRGEDAADGAGSALDAADLDGDGYPDLLIGAPFEDDGDGVQAGSWYLEFGPIQDNHSLGGADAQWRGEAVGDEAGAAVVLGGDLDGDGSRDLAASAPVVGGADALPTTWVVLGAATDATIDARVRGGAVDDEAGRALLMADLEGDGVPELILGGPGDGTVGVDGGAVWVLGAISGDTLGVGDSELTLTGQRAGERFGSALTAGDLDGDGWIDLAVGAPGSNQGAEDGGAVYVYPGPQSDAASPASAWFGATPSARVGAAIAWGEAPSGGGALLIGGPGAGAETPGEGAVWRQAGGSPGTGLLLDSDALLLGEQAGSGLGAAVGGGDLDGDGQRDAVVGAPGIYGASGAVYLLFSP